jgi:hypothetical protein
LGIDVFAGKMISGDRAFAEILRRSDRVSCFTRIIAAGTNEAQMYALVALRELSPARYEIELKRLKGRRFKVITIATEQQGVLKTEPSESVIKSIVNGMYRREVEFWLTHDLPPEGAWKGIAAQRLERLKAQLGKGRRVSP